MAVLETSKSAVYGLTYGPGVARQLICDAVVVACATTGIDNADDDVGLLWVPKNAVIVSAQFHCTDMDSGTALVWDVGDVDDEDRLFSDVTTGQTATSTMAMATTAFLYKYTARTQLRAYISTAAGTAVAGTLYFAVQYFVDADFSRTALVAA